MSAAAADSFSPTSHGLAPEFHKFVHEGYSSIRDGMPVPEPHAKKLLVIGWCGDIQDLVDSLNMFAPGKTVVTVLCDCCPEVGVNMVWDSHTKTSVTGQCDCLPRCECPVFCRIRFLNLVVRARLLSWSHVTASPCKRPVVSGCQTVKHYRGGFENCMPKQLQIETLVIHLTMLLMGCVKNMLIAICAFNIKKQQEAQDAMAALPEGDLEHMQPPGHPLPFVAYCDADDNLFSSAGSAVALVLDMNGVARPPAKTNLPLMWGFALAEGSALPFRLTSSAAVLPAGEIRMSSAAGHSLAICQCHQVLTLSSFPQHF